MEYLTITGNCLKISQSKFQAEQCYGEQVEQLKLRLAKTVRQHLFEIGEVVNEPGPLGRHGKADSDLWREAFNAEQATWERYFKQKCRNIVDFDAYGGSGSGSLFYGCQIRLILQRIQDIKEP